MAAFDVKWVALIIVLIGLSMLSCVAQTEATIACNSDDTGIACRYDCPAKLIQKHCITEKVVLDVVEGKCCPGYFKTENNKCQVCPDGRFMPDVNNCSECLLCTDCDTSNIANNTLEFRCNLTTNAGCKMTDDPTPCAHPDCPWIIKSSSAAPTTSTQVPTSEAVSVDTPRDPQESKSEGTYKAGFFAVLVLSIFSFVVNVLLCIYICKRDKKQTAVCEKCQAAGPVGGQAVAEGGANGNIRNNNGVDDGPGEQVPLQAVVASPQ